MYRIKNAYNWKSLRHWTTALENGMAVYLNEYNLMDADDYMLENALKLLHNDCFPISLMCIYREECSCKICLTPLWKGIFDFIKNERSICINGERILFSDIMDDEQKKILSATIFSIWISNEY